MLHAQTRYVCGFGADTAQHVGIFYIYIAPVVANVVVVSGYLPDGFVLKYISADG